MRWTHSGFLSPAELCIQWPQCRSSCDLCVSLCRSIVQPLRSHVWKSPMRRLWRSWWTRLFIQADQQPERGPIRPAPSLASVPQTHTWAHTHTVTHLYCHFFDLILSVFSDQTCEDVTCPFSGLVTLQTQTQVCTKVFGISQHSLPARITFTNTYFGGDKSPTHRILYVNGESRFNRKHPVKLERRTNPGTCHDLMLYLHRHRWSWPMEGAVGDPWQDWGRRRCQDCFHKGHGSLCWYDEQQSHRSQLAQESKSSMYSLSQS